MQTMDLSLTARSLPQQIRIMADAGRGGTPGTVVLTRGQLAEWADAADELVAALDNNQPQEGNS